MTRINYTARAKQFGTLSSIYCRWCKMQGYYQPAMMAGNKYAVSADKLLNKPFFGMEFGPGKGSLSGNSPKDLAFQKAVYKAMIAHSRDVHPQNIANMIRLGWIKA
jgi:hypothetical protein